MDSALADRLAKAAATLAAVSDTPRLDAELLLGHALGLSRAALLARLHQALPAPQFDQLLRRRLLHEPVAHILGEWEFYSLPLYTTGPVLVPRPETEHLVEAVLAFVGDGEARVLDLCTGSGCVAVAIAVNAPRCRVDATDRAPEALALAQRNVRRHGLDGRVRLCRGDLFEALPDDAEAYDAICANPPYVAEAEWEGLAPDIRLHEDRRALVAGTDGLDVIRRIAREAHRWLRPQGLLALEIGDGQYPAVADLLTEAGYHEVTYRRDLAGISRIATALRPIRPV